MPKDKTTKTKRITRNTATADGNSRTKVTARRHGRLILPVDHEVGVQHVQRPPAQGPDPGAQQAQHAQAQCNMEPEVGVQGPAVQRPDPVPQQAQHAQAEFNMEHEELGVRGPAAQRPNPGPQQAQAQFNMEIRPMEPQVQIQPEGQFFPQNLDFSTKLQTIDSNVSASNRQKIMAGDYINLGLLLFKNPIEMENASDVKLEFDRQEGGLVVRQRQNERKIFNISQWSNAFLVYTFVYIKAHPLRANELICYMYNIRHSCERYGFLQAKNYDEQFRLQQAQYPTRSWAFIDPQLFLYTMPATSKQYHNVGLSNVYNKGRPTLSSGKPFVNTSSRVQRTLGFCFRYNNGKSCFAPKCRFKHACESCGDANHIKKDCPGK